jgi:Fe-S-cluster containining protein
VKFRLPVLVETNLAEAKALQAQMSLEYEQKLRRDTKLSCTKGCAHCCHHPFLINIMEGILLLRNLKSKGLWTTALKQRVEAHRTQTMGLSAEVWLLSHIACPLLDEDNACHAYEARPLHCRATFSTGNPIMCHPHKLGPQTKLTSSSDVIIEYNTKLMGMLKRMNSRPLLMTVSEALTIAADIEAGKLDIEDVVERYREDLIHA